MLFDINMIIWAVNIFSTLILFQFVNKFIIFVLPIAINVDGGFIDSGVDNMLLFGGRVAGLLDVAVDKVDVYFPF